MAARAASDPSGARPAAAVLIAIDGKDADGVRAALGKAAPDPLPEPSPDDIAALRARFTASARTYATPTGGVNTVMAPARSKHRSSLIGAAGGTAAAVAVVAAAGWFALNHLPSFGTSAVAPTASGSPSPTTLSVTWNPKPAADEAMEGFGFPRCGDDYTPKPTSLGGISGKPSMGVEEDPSYGDYVWISDGFVTDDATPGFVLAGPAYTVITLDDKVIYVSDTQYHGLSLFTANNPVNNGGFAQQTYLQRIDLCDAKDAHDAFNEKWRKLLQADSSDAQQEKYDAARKKFIKKMGDFPPGTYRIYQVNPVVFGEQEALAEVFATEGITQVDQLEYDITYTNLAQDPRVAPYCAGDWNVGDFHCEPPADVLKEVLTREIDPAKVKDTKGGVIVSEPLEYTVE
jgi:hypothetical protein